MEPNHERSIVPRPDFRIEKSAGGENRIVAAMVNETLVTIRAASEGLHARFKIGAYEWCEPDYRQILAWAKALVLDPETVIQRLLDDRSLRETGRFPTWAGTRFDDGKITALHWDLDLLPLEHFVWVDGVDLVFLSFSAHRWMTRSTTGWVNGSRPVKTLQLPFPNLRSLSCGNLDLRELDLTRVGNLEELNCCRTHISHFDLSRVPLLRELDCSETRVSAIDLSHTPMLASLDCNGTNVATLDLSRIPNLCGLTVGETQVSELDLRSVPLLEYLNCQNTAIAELDLWCVPRLNYLDCRNTPIVELDLAAVPRLDFLWCSCTRIARLDLAQVPRLTSLACDSDVELDLSDVPKVEYLLWQCQTSKANEPRLSSLPRLKEFHCNGGNHVSITRLDLSTVPELEKLSLEHLGDLTELDLSAAPNLTEVYCSSTPLTELDIRPLRRLRILYYDVRKTRLLQRSDQNFKK